MQPAPTPIDDLRDYAFLTEPYPCQNCRHAARCKASDSVIRSRSASTRTSVFISGVTRH